VVSERKLETRVKENMREREKERDCFWKRILKERERERERDGVEVCLRGG
jgi:hypothetical protein